MWLQDWRPLLQRVTRVFPDCDCGSDVQTRTWPCDSSSGSLVRSRLYGLRAWGCRFTSLRLQMFQYILSEFCCGLTKFFKECLQSQGIFFEWFLICKYSRELDLSASNLTFCMYPPLPSPFHPPYFLTSSIPPATHVSSQPTLITSPPPKGSYFLIARPSCSGIPEINSPPLCYSYYLGVLELAWPSKQTLYAAFFLTNPRSTLSVVIHYIRAWDVPTGGRGEQRTETSKTLRDDKTMQMCSWRLQTVAWPYFACLVKDSSISTLRSR